MEREPSPQEQSLSQKEREEIDFFKGWYNENKQKHPDMSEEDLHTTIISGLGYHLSIPGYRLRDRENPDAKPTEEQQARLEELYAEVVETSKTGDKMQVLSEMPSFEEHMRELNRRKDRLEGGEDQSDGNMAGENISNRPTDTEILAGRKRDEIANQVQAHENYQKPNDEEAESRVVKGDF